MDLFDAIPEPDDDEPPFDPLDDDDDNPVDDEADSVIESADDHLCHWEGFEAPEPPVDAELEAQFCGQERAGIPSVSKTGQAVRARWRAFLEAQPEDKRAFLDQVEEESYRAARRRNVALAAIDAEKLPE